MEYLALCTAAFAAGAVNSLAGGGTLLTFPALLAAGVTPVIANTTSTVALVPGSIAGAWGYRRELDAVREWVKLLFGPSLLGGLVGAVLLVILPARYFTQLVPWLILTATLLFLLQPWIARWTGIGQPHKDPNRISQIGLVAFQFLVALYGGYFGAGIGILMLSALSLMGLADLHRMNAAKTFLAAAINGIAVAVFVSTGEVHWPYAAVMAAAAVVGGYAGARSARRMPRELVRWMVIAIGLGLSAKFFADQWRG